MIWVHSCERHDPKEGNGFQASVIVNVLGLIKVMCGKRDTWRKTSVSPMVGCSHFFDSGILGAFAAFRSKLSIVSSSQKANTWGGDRKVQEIGCMLGPKNIGLVLMPQPKIEIKRPTPQHRKNAALPTSLFLITREYTHHKHYWSFTVVRLRSVSSKTKWCRKEVRTQFFLVKSLT